MRELDPAVINRLVRWGCVLAGAVWVFLAANKFINFGYHDWDLALYAQVMQNMVHGSLAPSLFGMNFLGNHAEYISFLIAPVYFLFPHPLTLVVVNTAGFCVAAYLLYRIARRYLPLPIAAALTGLYIIHPANVFMLSYEFHFESLAIPFIMSMFLFYIEKRFVPFMIAGAFACLCKEHIPAVPVMFAVMALFSSDRDRRKWVLIPGLAGLAYFFIVMWVLIPWARSGLVRHDSIYWSLVPGAQLVGGGGFFAKAQAMAVQLATPINCRYLSDIFFPLLFIPIIGGELMIPAIPFMAIACLAPSWTVHTIFFHYAATLMPCVFAAATVGFHRVHGKVRPAAVAVLMILCAGSSILPLQCYYGRLSERLHVLRQPLDEARAALILRVPPNEPVVASFVFLSHLTTHKDLYAFYNVWVGTNFFRGDAFVLPDNLRWALVDMEDPWLTGAREDDPIGVAGRLKGFFDDSWTVKAQAGSNFLLQRHFGVNR